MKNILKILLFLSFSLILLGYILPQFTSINGIKLIGIGVLLFAFVIMPLFIYHRYKGRIGDFIDKRMEKPEDKTIN